jgi:hypothetical protein
MSLLGYSLRVENSNLLVLMGILPLGKLVQNTIDFYSACLRTVASFLLACTIQIADSGIDWRSRADLPTNLFSYVGCTTHHRILDSRA